MPKSGCFAGRSMRIYISADEEGISGVVGSLSPGGAGDEERSCRLMTQEVNAAIEGALEAGATEVVVNDSHGSMRNLRIEDINPEAVLIAGSPKPMGMMQGIDSRFDAVFLVGYHARMGTPGVWNHTISGGTVANIWVNDVVVGEAGLNAMIAGYYGVPVAMVTGDQCLAREVHELMPWVEAVEVKQAITRYAAACLPPAKAHEAIRKGAGKALAGLGEAKPLTVKSPVKITLQLRDTGQAEAAARLPGAEVVDPLTVAYAHSDFLGAVQGLDVMITLGQAGSFRR